MGLLAEASLQNDKKPFIGGFGGKLSHKPSPLGFDGRPSPGRSGSTFGGSSPNYRTSDVRGGRENGDEDQLEPRGVALPNYFKPGAVPIGPLVGNGEARLPELLSIVTREEIGELFDIFYDNSASSPLL